MSGHRTLCKNRIRPIDLMFSNTKGEESLVEIQYYFAKNGNPVYAGFSTGRNHCRKGTYLGSVSWEMNKLLTFLWHKTAKVPSVDLVYNLFYALLQDREWDNQGTGVRIANWESPSYAGRIKNSLGVEVNEAIQETPGTLKKLEAKLQDQEWWADYPKDLDTAYRQAANAGEAR